MIAVLQRVSEAGVSVEGREIARISAGIVVLLGVAKDDTEAEAVWLANKTAGFRMFEDDAGRMNMSVCDMGGEALVISQFTLLADGKKGRRPSFGRAADPEEAERLYEFFIGELASAGVPVKSGSFGAKMEVSLVNDGPVTFVLSRNPA